MEINLNGWLSPETPPDTDRIVILVRAAAIGVGLWRDIGYYQEGQWVSVVGDNPLHEIVGWLEYPELPIVVK